MFILIISRHTKILQLTTIHKMLFAVDSGLYNRHGIYMVLSFSK